MVSFERVSTSCPDGTMAVSDVSFTVDSGEFVVLIGPSGCGKTTSLRMINRMVEPSGGRILLQGKDLRSYDPVRLRRSIGYVMQQIGLFPHMTIAENIQVVPKLLGWPRERRIERTRELLELVGMAPEAYWHRYPHELSGGQQQRIGVLRALASILPQMMADLLQAKTNLHVTTKLDMGGTMVAFNALKQGSIAMYPDYTGTGYMEVLKQPKPSTEQGMYNFVQQQYEKKFGLEWLKPFGFSHSYAVAVPKSLAPQDHLTTISSLAPDAPGLVAGIDSECQNRPDCLPGMEKTYGLKFKSVKTMDHSLVAEALGNGDIHVTDAFSTDGGLVKYHLMMLKDNKHFFPAYLAAPLKAHPEIPKVLNELSGKISRETMQQLNYEVDMSHLTVQQVAHRFLVQIGLLK